MLEYTINQDYKVMGFYIGTLGSDAPQITVGVDGRVTVFSSNFYIASDGYGVYITTSPMGNAPFRNHHINHR